MLGVLLLACGEVTGADAAPAEVLSWAQGPRNAEAGLGDAGLVGPEFPVNAPVPRMLETLAHRAGGFAGPAVAFDGEQYLVVWPDERREVMNLFGARVKADGTLLDEASFLVAEQRREFPTFIERDTPAVAFDGTRFLVLWEGDAEAATSGLFLTRVERDGDVLDPEGLRLPEFFDGEGQRPDIACDGEGTCLAVRTFFLSEDDLGPGETVTLGGVLLRDGEVVGTMPLRIAGLPAVPRAAAVAWSGSEFLVVWEDSRDGSTGFDIYGARVSHDGTVLGPDGGFPIAIAPGSQMAPDVAWTGSGFLVVWEDRRASTSESDVFGARVGPDARVLDPGGLPLSTAAGDQFEPQVSAGGGTALVVWTDLRGGRPRIRGARLEDGAVLDPSGFAVSSALFTQGTPALAFGDGRFLVTFGAGREGAETRTVLATRVDTEGDTLDSPALRMLRGAPAQRAPAAAFGGGIYLVAWEDGRDDAGTHIRAARVRRDGSLIGLNGIRLPGAPGASGPAITFDGRNFLVVWTEPGPETTAVRAARVSPSGTVLDPGGLFIATTPTFLGMRARVASGGGLSFVVWTDTRLLPSEIVSELRGARVTQTGTLLDPGGFLLAPEDEGAQLEPAVAFVGGRFIVVYHDRRTFFLDRVLATRVTTGGSVLDATGIHIAPGGLSPAIAAAGGQALVVWRGPAGTPTGEILGARLLADGTVLDPGGFAISSGAETFESLPAVTFDGSRYWVAWQEHFFGFGGPDIRGARVRTDGTVLEPEGVPIATEAFTEELSPALASDGRGDSAVFYSRFAREPPLLNFRIQGRLLE